MKYLALTMVVALAFAGNVCAADEGDKYVVGVSGMTWGSSCTKAVRETLTGMNGVAKVTVDFKAKTATIHAKNGTTIKRRAVARLLKKGGYGVTSFKAPQAATTTVYAIGVTGMRWQTRCASKVRETLAKVEGVQAVKVEFAKKTALITMKSGKKLGESSTTKAIKGLGFGVSSFKLVSKPVKKKVRGQRRRGEKGKKPGESSGKLVKYSFGIGGMTWGSSCTRRVRAILTGMPGVSSVNVDFGKKSATVEMKKGASFDKGATATALKKGGYTVKSWMT